jgi:osmotically-inducible protein OsmY
MPVKRKACAMLVMLALPLGGCMGFQFHPQERSFFDALDDFNIQTELNAKLIGESTTLFARVDSSVIEARIHLSGTVPAPADRMLATRIAWSIPRVREVVNDIEVTREPGIIDAARDRWITASVRSLILNDPSIRDSNYTIDTENGVVYINGIGQSRAEIDRVMSLARTVKEARRVVNYAVLKDDPRRTAGSLPRVVAAAS